MKIAGYLQTSLIEWPGKISAVIFTPGCNFRCSFCHNADLVDLEKIKKLPQLSEKEVLSDLKKRKKWIDGVVITGGEPLLQKNIDKFLKKLKRLGFTTMIKTNGSVTVKLQELIRTGLLDCLVMDYKAPLEKYPETIGAKSFDPETVKKSIKFLLKSKTPFELRTTIVPGIHDQKTLIKMGKELETLCSKPSAPSLINWLWQNFRPRNCLDQKFEKKKPYSQKELKNLLKIVRKEFPDIGLKAS